MKNSKYNFEQEIKKQIEEREINPSRDLWAEIENQKENNTSKKSKISWSLLAACLVVIFGLGAILLFNNDKIAEPQMAETTIQTKNTEPKMVENNPISPVLKEDSKIIDIKENTIDTKQKLEDSKLNIVQEENKIPIIKENFKDVIEKPTTPISTSFAKIDSANFLKKKKSYVDASTLLFSVEHKDVIEKTKGGSNVATIDLNSK